MSPQSRHDVNQKKGNDCFAQLQSMAIVPKSQMWKFYKNVSRSWVELDKEFVQCRRQNKISAKYESLEAVYYECITVFEQWSIMAALQYS
jgi:hypothetical protein